MDMENAVADIGNSLFERQNEPVETAPEEPVSQDTEQVSAPAEAAPAETAPTETPVREVPKSWPKEMHEHWAKTPAEVQQYWERREAEMLNGLNQYKEYFSVGKQMNEVVSPYLPMIQQAGLDAPKAVSYLLAAHARLTQGDEATRRAAYEQLGRDLGFHPDNQPEPLREALSRVDRIESMLTQHQQRQLAEARQRTAAEVEAFAKDKPDFDELSGEIVAFIQAGKTLEQAYEMARFANPSVRAKEIARLQQEAQEAALKKAKEEAEAAKKATAANVRGRNTQKAPTESKGKFLSDESLKEALREIQERATH